jgi:hypothetical protein
MKNSEEAAERKANFRKFPNDVLFAELVDGVEGRRQNATKERSQMLWPNLNQQALAAYQNRDSPRKYRNHSLDEPQN